MSIFGRDKEQDQRLNDMEEWLQGLTGVVQKNHLAVSQLRIDLLKMQSRVDNKLSSGDFDPSIMQLNEQLAKTRVVYEEAKAAAEDNWASLQASAMRALEELDEQLQEAAEQMDEDRTG